MDDLNMNYLLGRTNEEKEFINYLKFFEENKHNVLTKRGIYVYGNPGSGKSKFVSDLLKKMDYDIVKYDAGDVRNKNIIEQITHQYVSDTNVISFFTKKRKNSNNYG